MSDNQTNFDNNGQNNGHFNSPSNTRQLLEDDETSASETENVNNGDNGNKKSTVNSLLHLEEDETSLSEVEDDDSEDSANEDPALVQTKHSLVNSPWSRFGVVGGGAAVIFFLIYLFLGPIMNGDLASKKKESKVAAIPTAIEEKKESKKDGDVYAKLALQRQADELARLNGQKTPKEPKEPIKAPSENKDKQELLPKTATAKPVQQVAATTALPPRRVAPPPPTAPAPPPRIIRSSLPPSTFLSPIAKLQAKPQVTLLQSQTEVAAKPTDPQAELERLRSLGSAGQIYYTANASYTENGGSSDNTDDTDYTPRPRLSNRRSSKTEEVAGGTNSDTTASTSGRIEQLKPRWTPVVSVASRNEDELNDTKANGDYSSEEAGIIEGKQEQYLVVGEQAAATLETPLIWSSGGRSSNPQPQFVARLTEPLRSNTGEEAIPAGTLLSIEMQGVDPSGRAIAQVTAILKDGTEYPVSSGTIAVLGEGGNPLIANQYHNKGGEIFSLDAGLGLVSGLAKVGEIINQPDVQTSISQSGGGFSSVQTSSNGRRSIGAAFLSGAFGALSEQVKARNQKALQEIIGRPNIWFVKKGTKILITVNRSMQL
ncbi:TrbI/VirB10 family protein [Scytonema sp. PRP1]|uniref:TrbI/VirB10 family protein n=1 Tax=Scytonema sp. PRP1 TaxID=3120513 RepID=UPI00300D6E5D